MTYPVSHDGTGADVERNPFGCMTTTCEVLDAIRRTKTLMEVCGRELSAEDARRLERARNEIDRILGQHKKVAA